MKKAALIVTIIGLVLFVGGIAVIAFSASQAKGEDNSLAFAGEVTAQITNTRVVERKVGERKNKNRPGYSGGNTIYNYYVEFLVSKGALTYTKEQSVPKELYDEYGTLEKNNDMEFNLYVNPDGAEYLSLKDLEGATAEYQAGGLITQDIAVRMVVSMVAAFIGFGVLGTGLKMRNKNRY